MRSDAADAAALMAAHRYEEAIPLLQRAITQKPQDPRPRCLLAICLINVGKPREAADVAGSAIALDPQAEWPHRIRSDALVAMGKRGKAIHEAEEAVRTNPDEARALFALAGALLARRWRRPGGLRRAAQLVERGLALDPESIQGQELLGRLELRRRHWKTAEAAYRKALAAHPTSWALMNNLALALQGQRRYAEAIAMFENAARANPRSQLVQRNLYRHTRAYVGIGAFAILLLLNGLRVVPGLLRTDPAGALELFGFLAACGLGLWAIKWRRTQRIRRLSPTALTFYQVENRRELVRSGPFVGVWLAGALAIVFTSLMLFPALQNAALLLMVGGVIGWWFAWRYLWMTAVGPWLRDRL